MLPHVTLLLRQVEHTKLSGNAACYASDNWVRYPLPHGAFLSQDQAKSSGSGHPSMQGVLAVLGSVLDNPRKVGFVCG